MNLFSEMKMGIGLTIIFLGIVIFLVIRSGQTSLPLNNGAVSYPTQSTAVYNRGEVARHNKESDCWLIINSNVYNATDYIGLHPGGAANIINFCGKDATLTYNSQIKHGARSNADLASLLIGSLSN